MNNDSTLKCIFQVQMTTHTKAQVSGTTESFMIGKSPSKPKKGQVPWVKMLLGFVVHFLSRKRKPLIAFTFEIKTIWEFFCFCFDKNLTFNTFFNYRAHLSSRYLNLNVNYFTNLRLNNSIQLLPNFSAVNKKLVDIHSV